MQSIFSLIFESRFSNWSYVVPKENFQQLLYDFYAIANCDKVAIGFTNRPRKHQEVQNEDLAGAYNEAKENLLIYFKPFILDLVFFSISSEVVHFFDWNKISINKSNGLIINGRKKDISQLITKLLFLWNKLDDGEWKIPKEFQKSNKKQYFDRTKEERGNVLSEIIFSALLKQLGVSDRTGIEIALQLFDPKIFKWDVGFGGKAWQNIAKAWINLYDAKTLNNIEIYIDHIMDLEHNTGTVFDKIQQFEVDGDYEWLSKFLNFKADIKNIYQLINKTSESLKPLLQAYVYDLFGVTTEIASARKESFDTPEGKKIIKRLKIMISEDLEKPSDVLDFLLLNPVDLSNPRISNDIAFHLLYSPEDSLYWPKESTIKLWELLFKYGLKFRNKDMENLIDIMPKSQKSKEYINKLKQLILKYSKT